VLVSVVGTSTVDTVVKVVAGGLAGKVEVSTRGSVVVLLVVVGELLNSRHHP
jgi:hypothetical protein